jgi:hypothetical protein
MEAAVSETENPKPQSRCLIRPIFVLLLALAVYAMFLWQRFSPVIVIPDANGYWAQGSLLAQTGRTGFKPETDANTSGCSGWSCLTEFFTEAHARRIRQAAARIPNRRRWEDGFRSRKKEAALVSATPVVKWSAPISYEVKRSLSSRGGNIPAETDTDDALRALQAGPCTFRISRPMRWTESGEQLSQDLKCESGR